MKHDLRSKSVSTKVSEAELRVLESRAERAGLTLSEWVRDVLLGSSVDAGTMAAERAILAEMLAMRAILLNFMLKLSTSEPGAGVSQVRVRERQRELLHGRRAGAGRVAGAACRALRVAWRSE